MITGLDSLAVLLLTQPMTRFAFIVARVNCWQHSGCHRSGLPKLYPRQSDISSTAAWDYCIPVQDLTFIIINVMQVLLACSLRLLRCLCGVPLSSSRSASSPSVVAFVYFAMYELHVIVWCMNIYPGRRVSGLLTGKVQLS